jgi:DNA mismatch endonuclease (patch repair protein)
MNRSQIMSRIRGDNTKPEIMMMSHLEAMAIRYEYQPKMEGKPDFYLPGYEIALFVDGCFWHGCPKHFKLPKTNKAFWKNKIDRNKERRKEVRRALRKLGIKVVRVWEHDLSSF